MCEKDPVIVNQSLETSQICRALAKIFKLRVGTSTPRHSVIFPKKSIAFLVQPLCELSATWPPQGKYFLDTKLLERLAQFIRVNRNCYVFLTANSFQENEYRIIEAVENRFREEKVVFYLCDGASACVENILRILQPPNEVKAKIFEVKKLLNGGILENDVFQLLEKNINITPHDAMVLKDGCVTLANISSSSVDQLKDCSLSQKTAQHVYDFFHAQPKVT